MSRGTWNDLTQGLALVAILSLVGISIPLVVQADFGAAQGGAGGFAPPQGAGGGGSAPVVAGPVDGDVSTIDVYPSSGIVNDGSATATIIVVAKDADGVVIEGGTVTLGTTGGTLTQPSSVTDDRGQALGYLVSATAGAFTLNGTIDDGDITVAITGTCSVTFEDSGTSANDYPSDPGTLTVTTDSATQLTVAWAPWAYVDGYSLGFRTPPGSGSFTSLGTFAAGSVSYEHSALTADTGYEYSLEGLNLSTVGTYSLTSVGTTALGSDPLTILGGSLALWFDASDDASFTYSSGTVVATWTSREGGTVSLAPNAGTTIGRQDAAQQGLDAVYTTGANYLTGSQTAITTYPFTVWCAVAEDSATGYNTAWALNDGTATNEFYASFNGSRAGDPVAAVPAGGAFANMAESTTAYSVTVVHVVKIKFLSATSRSVWLDGAGTATNTNSVTSSGIDTVRLGGGSVSGGTSIEGYLCEFVFAQGDITGTKETQMDTYMTRWQP